MFKNYKILLSGLLFSIGVCSYAQVGVNTNNPQATLDVAASNSASPSNLDGLLVPRIDAFPASNPTSSQNGMMVFLTTADGIFEPGFYYWDNAVNNWTALGSVGNGDISFWSLDGNAGTDADINFIGTVDPEDLTLRTNNVPRLRFANDRSRISFLNNGNSVFIGASAGNNDDLSTNNNTFVGNSSGQENTSGNGNAAYGYQSLRDNTTGSGNLAIGTQALSGNISGSTNVAIGYLSAQNSTGSSNISIGSQSLQSNSGGNNNVAIGTGTLVNSNGTGNIAIGHNAGAGSGFFIPENNMLYIENSNALAPLIGGDFSNDRVGINVDLQNSSNLTHTLTVGGDVSASGDIETDGEFITPTSTYPDYVFESFYEGKSVILPNYKFKELSEVENYIQKNGHLPGVKSYKEVKANDFKIELGATSVTNLEKIEEAFLYIIQLNHQVEAQEKKLEEKDAKIEELESRISKLEKLFSEKQ